MTLQHTLARNVVLEGGGLHSGAPVRMVVQPAEPGAGVVFERLDVTAGDRRVPATARAVTTTQLGTNITNAEGVSIATVEHFLAACFGLELDNLHVQLDGPELPILDGSSRPFCEALAAGGRQGQSAPRERIRILKPVEVREGSKFARFSPGEGFAVDVTIDFASRAIGRQHIVLDLTPEAFVTQIAPARTFGFAQDIEKLHAMGLARGGGLHNAIVVDGDNILTPDGLQWPDEFVRHKVLDVVGDLFLAGRPIEGRYDAHAPGHALNNRLLRAVLEDPAAFERIA